MAILPGTDIGRYHVLEQLGEGGMAVVYKAYDTQLEREVAVKVLRFNQTNSEVSIKRFRLDAKILAKLKHASIIKILDYGEHENVPYLIMDFINGGTLKEMTGSPVPWKKALRLLIPIARALAFAHKYEILHRDVKPSNILIDEEGNPLLTDFGIAKMLEMTETIDLTRSGFGIGTPEYMPPEVFEDQPLDVHADIYSLGIVLYELVTGRTPFKADTPLAILKKHATQPLPRPSSYAPSIPKEIEQILFKALAKDPKKRFQNMDKFADVMEALLNNEFIQEDDSTDNKTRNYVLLGILGAFIFIIALFLIFRSERSRTSADDYVEENSDNVSQTESSQISFEDEEDNFVVTEVSFSNDGVYSGTCPYTFLYEAYITSSSPGNVIYNFEYSDGSISSKRTLEFDDEETQTVSGSWTLTQSGDYWVKVNIQSPNNQTFGAAKLSLTCNSSTDDQKNISKAAEGLKEFGIGSTQKSTVDGMKMVYIPAGEFEMGASSDDSAAYDDEKPQHTVYLDAFWIDATEVTNGMYKNCVQAGACSPQKKYSHNASTGTNHFDESKYSDYPAVYVSWEDADDYCQWADRRLPTEAEWEKAAKGETDYRYPWGNSSPNSDLANCDGMVGDTVKVGSYPAGASVYGALDMTGNVYEWVSDLYGENYYSVSASENPQGPSSGSTHVIRGGSFFAEAKYSRTTYRATPSSSKTEGYGSGNWGFRCAMDVD